uniref:Uncharacterized protein n=1 Tax=Wuchereria bancrofti TaxID=6293 RepID=A0AAF5RWS5_WUCBA
MSGYGILRSNGASHLTTSMSC